MNGKAQQWVRSVRGFVAEVGSELRKTTWPDRRELMESTVVVVIFIVLLAAVVMVCDRAIQFLLRLLHA
jgi:preprotein translocase subunit SecE